MNADKENSGISDKKITMRIRGRSNVASVQEGSLFQSITQQKSQAQRQKSIKDAKKRIKMLNKLEEYRQQKLLEEVENIEKDRIEHALVHFHILITPIETQRRTTERD